MAIRSHLFHILCAVLLALLQSLPAAAEHLPGPKAKVGLIVASTGYAASLGNECRLGFETGRLAFPFPDVEFVYGDSRSEGSSAVSEFKKLTALDRVVAVVTHQSQPTLQINPLSRRLRLPLLGVIAQDRFLLENGYAFRFWPSAKAEAETLVPAIKTFKTKRLAVVTVEDEYALSIRESVLAMLNNTDTRTVFDQQILKTDNDFLSLLIRLKRTEPDGIFVNVAINQLVPFVRRIRELGLKQQLFGNGWFMTKEVEEALGNWFLEGVIFARLAPDKPGFTEQLARVSAHALPTPVTYACFSGMAALSQAVRSSARPLTSQGIFDALRSIKRVSLPDESLNMVDGELWFNLGLKIIKGGKVLTFPAP